MIARDGDLLTHVLGVFLRKVFAWQRRRARAYGIDDPPCGAVTFVERLEMVTEALEPVRPQIDACRTETTPHGLVKVRMRIDSDGVPHTEIQSTRVRALGECVVKAVNEARFPRTRHGAELTYPFPF